MAAAEPAGAVRFRVEAYPRAARAAAAALAAVARASLLLALGAVLRASDPPVTLAVLARDLALFAALPEAAARLLGRAFRTEAQVEGDALVLRRRLLRVEVPCASIAGVEPWRAPLPGPGFGLRLRSGARLGFALAARDPAPMLRALAEAGVGPARAALAQTAVVYAETRAASPRPAWQRPALKFVAFALVPGGVAFYAHQHIAFGAFLGEYYLMGAAAWLRSAAAYWVHAALLLVLYASALRALVEVASLLAAHCVRARAAAVRRAAEPVAAALYYAGVPALLALRFLS
jgi:apolipoprotein N-acyltransferase